MTIDLRNPTPSGAWWTMPGYVALVCEHWARKHPEADAINLWEGDKRMAGFVRSK